MYTELADKTTTLISLCNESFHRLEQVLQDEKHEPDFFNEVKPFVDAVMGHADKWKKLSIDWIEKERPKNLHPNQIDATHENIQLISIQSFYPDTKIKRYKAMYESILYVLKDIKEKLEK